MRKIALLCLGLSSGACALPQGSMARPVAPAADGAVMIGGGVMAPLYVASGAKVRDSDLFGGSASNRLALIPGASFDLAFDPGAYFGLGVTAWTPATLGTSNSDIDFLAVFVNPRFEVPLNDPDRTLSITIDGNLGWIRTGAGGDVVNLPFFSPTIGLRWYIPTGFGGPIFSQQIGTGILTLILPGSLAYDIPIPLGANTKLHVYPEIRWDPTGLYAVEAAGFIVFLSGGLSVMLEI